MNERPGSGRVRRSGTFRPWGGKGPLRRSVREAGIALITLSVIIVLFIIYQLFGTGIAEARSQSSLKRQFEAATAGVHQPAGRAEAASAGAHQPAGTTEATTRPNDASPILSVPIGAAIDHLVVPRINLDAFVVEGTDENSLRRGPGHYSGTALPGQDGNVGIAGHRTTYGAPFSRLNELSPGDLIYLTDRQNRSWVYEVSEPSRVVSPGDVAVLTPTPFPALTLTTCNPRFSATSRLVVFARLTESPAGPATQPVAPVKPGATVVNAGSPPAPKADAGPGNGTSSALAPAIFYGTLFVLLCIGTRIWMARSRRWHRVGAFAAGAGVCLIALWLCFESAARLLPQSI